jgi:transposase
MKATEVVPKALRKAILPLIGMIRLLTQTIRRYDRQVRRLCEKDYESETDRIIRVNGVGDLTALAFVLVLDRPERFKKSRRVGAFLGLCPRVSQSGECDPQLRITKAGNEFLRRLLVQCAHYITGPFGKDSTLRRVGLRLMERGGARAKKRAVVAVARRLAVLLHRLWKSSEPYDALRGAPPPEPTPAPTPA